MTTSERLQHIQELFHDALQRPPGERGAFLNTKCPHDKSLRDEVELLLAEDTKTSVILHAEPEEGRLFTLSVGTRLGPYEITGTVGAGGMGEVYRARDSKLQRDVALKVLPESFAHDAERISRFRREAQLLASLNHPNIAAIYGLEESGRLLAIAMELVEGPTLAERMSAGPVPLDEALSIAKQTSEALEAAHERGIVHRDLKPANVKMTRDGVIKVLDFGLGKVVKGDSSAPHSSATRHGVILGTAAYMSPEQARGLPVDTRTDIWAFGVLLYELLTGVRLFAGETTSDTLASVLAKEPDWNRIPVQVRRLLQRCLEKDPKQRLHHIADVWMLLDEEPQPGPQSKSTLLWAAAGAIVVVIALAFWVVSLGTRTAHAPLQPLVRLDVDLGNDVSLGSLRGPDVILSPDGNRLVYVSQSRLFTRRLDQANSMALLGTQQAYAPFFSPDGQWVAFFADRKLKKVAVEGGPPIELCDAPSGAGGSWGEDGSIIASIDGGGLSRIPSNGGAPTRVTELASGEEIHRWPQILPQAQAILFSAFKSLVGLNGATIEAISLRDRRRKTLVRGGTWVRYVPDGRLIYVNKGTLLAISFDADRLEVRGTPIAMLDDVAYSAASGAAQVDVSRSGSLVYRSGQVGSGLVTVELLEGSGNIKPLLRTPGDYLSPTLSPDGKRLAFISGGDIWVYDLRRDTKTRLTFQGGLRNIVWSPDSRFLTFRAAQGMLWIRADGSGTPQPLTRASNSQTPSSFTSDGKWLAFVEITPTTGADIWILPVESDGTRLQPGTPRLFLQTPFNERAPAFSPDGRWLAYFSDESGKSQVFVRAFRGAATGPGSKWQISKNEGSSPVWSLNGRDLFFRSENNQLMAVTYKVKGDLFVADEPRLWSDEKLAITPASRGYDAAPDGKSVLVSIPAEDLERAKDARRAIFLFNFFDELRRRLPTSGTVAAVNH